MLTNNTQKATRALYQNLMVTFFGLRAKVFNTDLKEFGRQWIHITNLVLHDYFERIEDQVSIFSCQSGCFDWILLMMMSCCYYIRRRAPFAMLLQAYFVGLIDWLSGWCQFTSDTDRVSSHLLGFNPCCGLSTRIASVSKLCNQKQDMRQRILEDKKHDPVLLRYIMHIKIDDLQCPHVVSRPLAASILDAKLTQSILM